MTGADSRPCWRSGPTATATATTGVPTSPGAASFARRTMTARPWPRWTACTTTSARTAWSCWPGARSWMKRWRRSATHCTASRTCARWASGSSTSRPRSRSLSCSRSPAMSGARLPCTSYAPPSSTGPARLWATRSRIACWTWSPRRRRTPCAATKAGRRWRTATACLPSCWPRPMASAWRMARRPQSCCPWGGSWSWTASIATCDPAAGSPCAARAPISPWRGRRWR